MFDSRGAFDIILGKPWLRQVKAIHDYNTDQIVITQNDNTETLSNSLSTPPPTTIRTTQTAETDPRIQMDREWARIHQLRASSSPWQETRWALHLPIDPMEPDDDETDLTEDTEHSNYDEVITTPLSAKER